MRRSMLIAGVVGLLALAALIAALYVADRGGEPAEENVEQPMERTSPTAVSGPNGAAEPSEPAPPKPNDQQSQDETPPSETQTTAAAPTKAGVEAAQAYDRTGQVGERPADWKEDYSHWDTAKEIGVPLETIGIPQPNDHISYMFQPAEAARQRIQSLTDEKFRAADDGLLTHDETSGYIRLEFDEGEEIVYVAPSFIDRFNAIEAELDGIYEENMTPVKGSSDLDIALGYANPEESFQILYYRRPSDGVLVREVTLADGAALKFTAAPAADLSGLEADEVESLKGVWEEFASER